MKSFSQLLSQAWQTVFRNQETFWTLFLLGNGPILLQLLVFYIFGYNIFNPVDLEAMIIAIVPYVIFIGTSIILSGFFGFISTLYLSHLFKSKKIKLKLIFSEWRKIFSYIGTMLSFLVAYVAVGLMIGIIFGVIFLGGYIGYQFVPSLNQNLAIIISILGGLIGIGVVITAMIFAIWISVGLFAFFIPAFFLDDKKYFQALLFSRKMMNKRWWKTVGNLLAASIITMAIPMILSTLIQFFPTLNIGFSILFVLINGVASLIFTAFIFSLYIDCRDNPVKQN